MVRFNCNHTNQMRFTVKNIKVFTVLFLILNININMSANTKVYIIHGHGGNRLLMNKITKHVQNEGYTVENFGYPSFTEDIVSVSERLYNKIIAENYDTISFVTHSMGALIVRNLYSQPLKSI
jgi:triacylglycerol esterase/lipase EstA (alpha/beta hydrolase family)